MPHVAQTSLRVLVADDSEPVLDALVARLESASGLEVVAAVRDGFAARQVAATGGPGALDIALVDARMPAGGPQLVRDLLSGPCPPVVVVFTGLADPVLLRQLWAAGAAAVVLKGDPTTDVVDELRRVGLAAGGGATA